MDDLRILAVEGIPALRWNYEAKTPEDTLVPFQLRAHLLTFTGDMPAIAKVCRSLGTRNIIHRDLCKGYAFPWSKRKTALSFLQNASNPQGWSQGELLLGSEVVNKR